MNKVIEDVAHTYLIKVKNVNGTLTTDLGAEHSIVYGDEIHLTNVIFNLLDNALKYRREEEPLKLRITTRNDGNHMVISIEDNGIGIKREKPSQDIRPFLQSAYRQPPRRKGFGLGLAYVKTDCESARWKHTRRKPIRSRHQLCNNITNNKRIINYGRTNAHPSLRRRRKFRNAPARIFAGKRLRHRTMPGRRCGLPFIHERQIRHLRA